MIAFLAGIVGPKLARPALALIIGLIVLSLFLTVRACTRDTTAERQAEQTNASGDAIANAAADAIETIENRTVTEKAVDDAVAATTKDIADAPDPDHVRAAVLAGVCGQPSHRNDPACKVR